MEWKFETLEEYYRLLLADATDPPPLEAHSCAYCSQITVELPDSNATAEDNKFHCLVLGLTPELINLGVKNGCPYLRMIKEPGFGLELWETQWFMELEVRDTNAAHGDHMVCKFKQEPPSTVPRTLVATSWRCTKVGTIHNDQGSSRSKQ